MPGGDARGPVRKWRRGPEGVVARVAEPAHPAAPASLPAPSRRPKLGLALRLGVRDTYDYLGTVLLISIGWCLIAGAGALGGQALALLLSGTLPPPLPTALGLLGAYLGLSITLGPFLSGCFRFAWNAAARAEPEVFDLAWGFRYALGPSFRLAAIQWLGAAVLGANAWFYFSLRQPWSAVLAALFGYALLFWLLAALYQWPLLASQAFQVPQAPVRSALKKSALLVLDNLGFALLLGLPLALLTGLLWVSMVGGALLWAGSLSMLLTQALRELLRKYGILGPDPTLDPIAGEATD